MMTFRYWSCAVVILVVIYEIWKKPSVWAVATQPKFHQVPNRKITKTDCKHKLQVFLLWGAVTGLVLVSTHENAVKLNTVALSYLTGLV